MTMTFGKPIDDFAATLAAPHAIGDGALALSSAAGLGTLAADEVFRVTVGRNFNTGSEVILGVFVATGIAGDTLTAVAADAGYADVALAAGCDVEVRPTARTVAEIQDAVRANAAGLAANAAALAGKLADAANLSDLADAATARTNLGLGTAATHAVADFLAPTGDGGGLTNLTPANIAAGTAAISITGNAATATTAVTITGSITESQVTGLTGSLAAKADDSAVVHATGDESIAGLKTFSDQATLGGGVAITKDAGTRVALIRHAGGSDNLFQIGPTTASTTVVLLGCGGVVASLGSAIQTAADGSIVFYGVNQVEHGRINAAGTFVGDGSGLNGVVHSAGDETIAGNKTFAASITLNGYNWEVSPLNDPNWGLAVENTGQVFFTELRYVTDGANDRRAGIRDPIADVWVAYGDLDRNFQVTNDLVVGGAVWAGSTTLVSPAAAGQPLILKGAVGQTARYLEIQDSTGTPQSWLGASLVPAATTYGSFIAHTCDDSSEAEIGMGVWLSPGSDSDGCRVAIEALTFAVSTGYDLHFGDTVANPVGASGLNGFSFATSTGANIGGYYHASGGDHNFGVVGQATKSKAGAENFGVVGVARNVGGTAVGGYFGTGTAAPAPSGNAAVIADGGGSDDILVGQVAGTVAMRILPDGSLRLPQLADAAAVNDSLYYSTTQSKVVYKDSSGTANPLS